MKKMGLFVHFPCLLPDLWSLKLSKKVHFLKFFADLSKKSKSIKAIYIHPTEYIVAHFQKMVLFIMLGHIRV